MKISQKRSVIYDDLDANVTITITIIIKSKIAVKQAK